MKQRYSYKSFPKHLQLDPAKALCPCGKKAVAVWQNHPIGAHIGFECESGHLFDLDLKNHIKGEALKTVYVSKMIEFNKQYKLPIISAHGMLHDQRANHVLDVQNYNQKMEHAIANLLNGKETDYKFNTPVTYKPTKIYDANGLHIISIRGWGRLQKLKGGDKIQDAIGNEIAELINSQ